MESNISLIGATPTSGYSAIDLPYSTVSYNYAPTSGPYRSLDPAQIINCTIRELFYSVGLRDPPEWSADDLEYPLINPITYGWTAQQLVFAYDPAGYQGRPINNGVELYDFFDSYLFQVISVYLTWIEPYDVIQLLPNTVFGNPVEYYTGACPRGICSSFEDCAPIYDSLLRPLADSQLNDHDRSHYQFPPKITNSLLDAMPKIQKPLECQLLLLNTTQWNQGLEPCEAISSGTWRSVATDNNLRIFKDGGIDSDGLRIYALGNESLSSKLREDFLGANPINCTLETLCEAPQDCDQVGSRFTATRGKPRFRSNWGYHALTAIANINQQLFNQFQALQSAGIEVSLAAFNIDDYFPKPDKGVGLDNILTGLSTVLSVVSGFVPFLGPGFAVAGATSGALGTIASTAGSYLERSVADNVDRSDPNVAQKRFAPIVRQIFKYFSESLDNITAQLLRGDKIDDKFDIYDMMRGGAWVDQSSLSRITDVQAQLFYEIISRAINGLWKTPTSNKMWVLYVDLDDNEAKDKCNNDTSGPLSLRYCDDGGVYYAYNFIEKSDHLGYRDYPWGADKMKFNLGIDPAWITEASARTYKLTKNAVAGYGLDPFNLNATTASVNFLTSIANGSDINGKDGKGMGGRYPGSWTLPVCNASTWGSAWNYDYTTRYKYRGEEYEHPPCFCGEGGSETANWATAAGLNHFDTFYDRCKKALTGTADFGNRFNWPDGVTSVDLGFGSPIQKPEA